MSNLTHISILIVSVACGLSFIFWWLIHNSGKFHNAKWLGLLSSAKSNSLSPEKAKPSNKRISAHIIQPDDGIDYDYPIASTANSIQNSPVTLKERSNNHLASFQLDTEELLKKIDSLSLEDFCHLLEHMGKPISEHILFLFPADKSDVFHLSHNQTTSKDLSNIKIVNIIKSSFLENSIFDDNATELDMLSIDKLHSLGFPFDDDEQYYVLRKKIGLNKRCIYLIISAKNVDAFHHLAEHFERLLQWYTTAYRIHCYKTLVTKASRCITQSAKLTESANEPQSALSRKIDGLTQLLNRNYFIDILKRESERSVRYHRSFSLIISDIDEFGLINQQYGYDAGDKALIHFTKLMNNVLRETDLAARWSGNQYAILLPETNHFGALRFAERLRIIYEKNPVIHNKNEIKATLTFGVITIDKQCDNIVYRLEETIKSVKKQGKNYIASEKFPNSL